jgi:hypothetical protein
MPAFAKSWRRERKAPAGLLNARDVSIEVRGKMRALRAPGRGSPARTSTNERLGSRTAHGNGTAFSAVAPSERPVLPSIDPIFGSGIPQARMVIQHSTSLSGSIRFRHFSWANLHCVTLCHPFATYRRVTHSAASTICRCIAGSGDVRMRWCCASTTLRIFLLGGRPRPNSFEAPRVYSPCS